MSRGFKESEIAVINALREKADSFEAITCPVCFEVREVVSLPCGGFICRKCYEEYSVHGKCPACNKSEDVRRPSCYGDVHPFCKVEREDIINPKFICPHCNEDHDYVPLPKIDNAETVSRNVCGLLELKTDKYTKAANAKVGKSLSELSKEHKKLEEELEGAKSQYETSKKGLEGARAKEKENDDKMRSLDKKLAENKAELERINKELSDKTSQNETDKQKLEEKRKLVKGLEEKKRQSEEEIAQNEREMKEIEERKERNRRDIQELEANISENKRILDELLKRDDDDDDDDFESLARRKKSLPLNVPQFTRTLQINVDFTPPLPNGSVIQQEGQGGAVGMMRGMINIYQNVMDAMPGPTQTKTMRDIEEFEVRERLGVWNCGKPVFKALLKENKESYALKKIEFREKPAPMLNASTWTSAKPTDEEKCQHSINALSDDELLSFVEPYILTSIHEGNKGISEIIKPEFYIRDKKSKGTLFYIAMPYYNMDLEYAITMGIVKKTQLRSIAEQLLKGIAYLHSLGIVHRDISTSSILIRKPMSQLSFSTCPITLAGMGHATLSSHARTSRPEFQLSRFHPPECFNSEELVNNDEFWIKADLWSVGCVLAEMALGRKMFSTEELPKIESSTVSERANSAADAIDGDGDDIGLIDCIRNTLVLNPMGRSDSIKLLNGLGVTPNVFSNEQPLALESGNIRTFISKVCPYVSI